MKKFVPRFVPQAVRSAVTVMAIAMAAFLLVGCEDDASPNNDGLVDGFLVRVNEKPGAGPGTGTSMRNVTVKSEASDAHGSGVYVVGTTVTINAGTRPNPHRFEKWTTASNGVTFASPNYVATTFIMPANDVTVTAVFWDWGTLTDGRDSKKYKTAKIGTQTWMAENLNYQPSSGNYWCYDNDNNNCNIYGRLYDWNTAMTACPAGWRLPSNQEWGTLVNYVGGLTAGTKLKSTSGWGSEEGVSGNGTDDYGFSALPGEYRDTDGSFSSIYSGVGNWWTATESGSSDAYNRMMHADIGHGNEYVEEHRSDKGYGLSVRCLWE